MQLNQLCRLDQLDHRLDQLDQGEISIPETINYITKNYLNDKLVNNVKFIKNAIMLYPETTDREYLIKLLKRNTLLISSFNIYLAVASRAITKSDFILFDQVVIEYKELLEKDNIVDIYDTLFSRKDYKFILHFIKKYRFILTEEFIVNNIFNSFYNLECNVSSCNEPKCNELNNIHKILEFVLHYYIMFNARDKEFTQTNINVQISVILQSYYYSYSSGKYLSNYSVNPDTVFLLIMLLMKFQHSLLTNHNYFVLIKSKNDHKKQRCLVLLLSMYNKIYFQNRYDNKIYHNVMNSYLAKYPFNDRMKIYLNSEKTRINNEATQEYYVMLNSVPIYYDKKMKLIEKANLALKNMNYKGVIAYHLSFADYNNQDVLLINTDINTTIYDEILLALDMNNYKIYRSTFNNNSLGNILLRLNLKSFQTRTIKNSLTYDNIETIYYKILSYKSKFGNNEQCYPHSLKTYTTEAGVSYYTDSEYMNFMISELNEYREKVIEKTRDDIPKMIPKVIINIICEYVML
jgi:hypothetical protein